MSEEFNASLNLTTEVCITCGVVFALPCILRKQLMENQKLFYCPNGHGQQFFGKTKDEEIAEIEDDKEVLSEEIERLEKRVKYYKNKANKAKEKLGK